MSDTLHSVKTVDWAGGLLWRRGSRGKREVAIVRDGESWRLPKGRVGPAQGLMQSAIRAVKAETHYDVAIGSFAGCTRCEERGVNMVVAFWNMRLLKEAPHVAEERVHWCTVTEALENLTCVEEMWALECAERITGEVHLQSYLPTARTVLISLWKHWMLPVSTVRLANTLKHDHLELEQQAIRNRSGGAFFDAARALSEHAAAALQTNEEAVAWRCWLAAERLQLRDLATSNPKAFQAKARTIHQEALDKLSSWRKKRIEALLGKEVIPESGANSKGAEGLESRQQQLLPENVYEACSIFHDHLINLALKRRANFKQMVLFFVVALVTVIAWLIWGDAWLDSRIVSGKLILATVTCGLMGACLSALISSAKNPAKVKIPDLLFTFRVSVIRLMVGALTATAAYLLLGANLLNVAEKPYSTHLILAVAFASGFSERLVVSALRRVSGGGDGDGGS